MINPKQTLIIAGILSFAIALFQAVVTAVPAWARYFGAWESVASKLWLLYLAGFFVAAIFAVFGLYALSGAGIIRRLPLLRTGLIIISIIFILRGLFLVMEIMVNLGILHGSIIIPTRELMSSAVSLIIGIIYLSGTVHNWSNLPVKKSKSF